MDVITYSNPNLSETVLVKMVAAGNAETKQLYKKHSMLGGVPEIFISIVLQLS